jgi:hypothetical protein
MPTRHITTTAPIGTGGGTGFGAGAYFVPMTFDRAVTINGVWIAYYEYSGAPNFTGVIQSGNGATEYASSLVTAGHRQTTQQWLYLPFTTPYMVSAGTSYRIGINATTSWAQNGGKPAMKAYTDAVSGVTASSTGDAFWWALDITYTSTAGRLTFTTPIHKQDSGQTLTVSGGTQAKHRVLLNGSEIIPWGGMRAQPYTDSFTIPNSSLLIGSNSLVVEIEDQDGLTGQTTHTLNKTNTAPTIVNNSTLKIHRDNFVLKATLGDANADKLSYRVLVGGVQKYPESGWTEYAQAPLDIAVTLPNDLFIVGSTTVRLEVMDDWFTPTTVGSNMSVTKANNTPTLAAYNFSRTSLHKEDLVYSATLADLDPDDKVSYRILINNVEAIPWTAYQAVPVSLTHTFQHSAFRLGSNTFTIEFKDDFQTPASNSSAATITKTNSSAAFVTPVAATIHGEDYLYSATITDSNRDLVQYRLYLNNVQIYPDNGDWSEPFPTPISVNRMFRNSELVIGSNVIKIEAKDDMQASASISTYTLTKSSIAPAVTVPDIKGWVVRATVSDGNGDKVGYRISYGGEQLYPKSGYTELAPTPFNIEYAIPANKVAIGVSKALLIELIDGYGVVGSRSTSVILQNGGLVLSPVPWGYVQSSTNGHYIRYNNNALNNLSRTGHMTLEGWFCKTGQGVNNPRAIAVSKGATYIDIGYNGFVMLSLQIGGSQRTFTTNYPAKMNVWEHYAFTYDGVEVRFYANGVYLPQTWTMYYGALTNTSVIDIGWFYGGNYNFVGGITEVRMWDVARTAEQIKGSMYNTVSPTEEGLVFYPDLGSPNRPSATTVADRTGQAAGVMVGSLPFSDALTPTFTKGDGTVVANVNLGKVVATQSSKPVGVCLKNFSGYCIENIRITPEQWELDPVSEVVQLSYSSEPFIPEPELVISEYIDHGEYAQFWVRVNAGEDAIGGGLCKLHVKADITFT